MDLDARRHSAAAERNREPILAVLQRVLPAQGVALEIASGSGQHAAYFAAALPRWHWWPTEATAAALPSIAAWCAGLTNVHAPVVLDVLAPSWPDVPAQADAVFCANLIHIAPWPTCAALMQGAARKLAPGGLLLVYGPFFVDGEPTAPGNRAFDADLRARNPAWGLRRLADVQREAGAAGLELRERIAMPANNLLLVFGRPGV
jgi:SAM-dependent methyltransferase